MNFKYKWLLQSVFSALPNSEGLNYFAQKHLTKNLPLSEEDYRIKVEQALAHHNTFKKYADVAVDSNVYEIGCGWHLTMALTFSTLEYSDIKALDVKNHVRKELVNSIIKHMKWDEVLPVSSFEFDKSSNLKEKLLSEYRINLLAPCDSANTGLEGESIDFIYSQEVFEHIPPFLFPDIMKECHRVLKDDGVVSIFINYADHYCSIDDSINEYNFLQYSEKKWKKYNPSLHYVNRLRHVDFVNIFKNAGFEIIEETIFRPDKWESKVKNFPFAEEFTSKYSLDELSITSANFVLKKVK